MEIVQCAVNHTFKRSFLKHEPVKKPTNLKLHRPENDDDNRGSVRNFVEADAEESGEDDDEGGDDAERGSTAGAGSASSRSVRKDIFF